MGRPYRAFGAQLGKETVAGTGVAANRLFAGLGIGLGPESEGELFTPQGIKVPTGYTPQGQWVEGEAAGFATYDELTYVLQSVLTAVAAPTAAPGGVSVSKLWTFTLQNDLASTYQTYTLEFGDGAASLNYQVTHAIFNSLNLEIEGRKQKFQAGLLGRHWTRGVSLTASPTQLIRVPILAKNWKAYLDNTWAAVIGGSPTQMVNLYKASWGVGKRYEPDFPINGANASFASITESESQDWKGMMLMAASANSNSLETDFEAGVIRYLRCENTGPIIDGTAPYKLNIMQPILVTKVGKPQAFNGVAVIPFDYTTAYDASGNGLKVELQNSLANL